MNPIQKFFSKLRHERHGIAAGVIALVVGFVVIGVGLSVGLMIIGKLDTTTDAMNLGTTGNSTRDTLFSNIYTGFDLTVILPIVAAATLIIAAVLGIMYFKGAS
jgi:hypothetical protein